MCTPSVCPLSVRELNLPEHMVAHLSKEAENSHYDSHKYVTTLMGLSCLSLTLLQLGRHSQHFPYILGQPQFTAPDGCGCLPGTPGGKLRPTPACVIQTPSQVSVGGRFNGWGSV